MDFDKAGRFFILGFDGTTVPTSLRKISAQHGLGGVILYGRNVKSSAQLKSLTAELKCFLSDDNPFIISIDQEGGEYQRLKPPDFKAYPAASEVTIDTAFDVGLEMGEELKELGINLNFAPVLDVNTNPNNPIIGKRSLGYDPQQVASLGRMFICGLHQSGVHACGKHFPGHGDTSEDSHLTLPVVEHSIKRLNEVELVPFRELIKSGLKFFMTAHVLYPALDKEHPATFSSKILTNLLKEKLGFKGLVISDDLGMAGALSQTDLPDACIQAFAAGCDLLLVCEHHERHEEVIEKLGKAIDKSPALQKRANESLERIKSVFR